ncbi:MAG: mechanosensitive ion channel [Marmoricola sp.]|nr:mechanosensitive ion channel [Marmoricola sp.]
MNIKSSLQTGLDAFFGFLPNVLGFLVILIIGFVVAKLVAAVTKKALDKFGLDRHLHESDANRYVERLMPGASPTKGIARVVFWLIFIFFLTSAIGALKIPAVTTFMNQVLAYLPNVIVAILIFVAAALIAGAVAAGVAKLMGDTPTGKVVATIVPALVMVIALFMILNQLKIAEQIVTIAFAATMGALALGLALAFGLGGRDVARRLLEDAYTKGQEAKDQAQRDLETARDRAQDVSADVHARAALGTDGPGSPSPGDRPDDRPADRRF